jgi:hypothetical protein
MGRAALVLGEGIGGGVCRASQSAVLVFYIGGESQAHVS